MSARNVCLVLLSFGMIGAGCQSGDYQFDEDAAPLSAVLHQLDRDLIGLALMLHYASIVNRGEGEFQKQLEQDSYLEELGVAREDLPELLRDFSARLEQMGELFEDRVSLPACAVTDERSLRPEEKIFLPDAVVLASVAVELQTISSGMAGGGLEVPLGVSGEVSRKEVNTTLIKTVLEPKTAFFVFASWVDQYDRAERQLQENPDDQAAQDTMSDLFRLSPLAVELFCAINASLSESYNVFVPASTTIEVSFQVQKHQKGGAKFDIAVVSGHGKAELSTDRVNKFIAEVHAIRDQPAAGSVPAAIPPDSLRSQPSMPD